MARLKHKIEPEATVVASVKSSAKKKSATKPATAKKANSTEGNEPATNRKLETIELTEEQWDGMDNLAAIPHNVQTHINVFEGEGKQRKMVGTDEYLFRHNGFVYQAIESTPYMRRFKIYQAVING